MSNVEKATEIISEILEEVTGGMEFDEDFDLSELEIGFEDLIACTKFAFHLSDNWVANGEKINSTLKVFVEHVCSQWDGSSINSDWMSVSEL